MIAKYIPPDLSLALALNLFQGLGFGARASARERLGLGTIQFKQTHSNGRNTKPVGMLMNRSAIIVIPNP